MKRFDFPLDRVLQVKRQLERVADLEQQRARARVAEAKQTLEKRKSELARHSDRIASTVGRAMTPVQWSSLSTSGDQFARRISEAENDLTLAEKSLAAAADAYSQIAREIEALSTFRTEQWEVWSRENQVAVQNELDEVGLRRWMANRESTLSRTMS